MRGRCPRSAPSPTRITGSRTRPRFRPGPPGAALRPADGMLDVLVVVAYGELLRADELEAARLGAVNVHFSLLPELRGAAPVQHALLRGMGETAGTPMAWKR